VQAGDRHAVSRYFQLVIDQVRDPQGFPRKRLAGYVPESTLLALEWRLPAPTIVPTQKSFKWIKTRDEITEAARSATEIRTTYQTLVAQIALRALGAVFAADRFSLAQTVVFNGIVDAIDPSTGQAIEPCLITLRATHEQFAPLVLRQLDPVACVRKYFAADVSPHPEELQAVPPVMEFKMADPRIIDPIDVISQIDKRPNLLELTPKEFEHFVHNLFDRMGFDTKIFKADGDGGVDCVAYDPTPIRGGKYVIQVKLYNKTVPPTAVRDLYGTMQHEGAQSGILITTSGFGPSSYEFAAQRRFYPLRSGCLSPWRPSPISLPDRPLKPRHSQPTHRPQEFTRPGTIEAGGSPPRPRTESITGPTRARPSQAVAIVCVATIAVNDAARLIPRYRRQGGIDRWWSRGDHRPLDGGPLRFPAVAHPAGRQADGAADRATRRLGPAPLSLLR
jgi:hypothetical protein